jgi:hypothetical protein
MQIQIKIFTLAIANACLATTETIKKTSGTRASHASRATTAPIPVLMVCALQSMLRALMDGRQQGLVLPT